MRHDLARSRWGVSAYAIVVLAATALILQRNSRQGDLATNLTSVFYLVGLFTIARQVQRDTLAAETSKAAGETFDAMTAFWARILTALLMIALPLFGQALIL